MDMIIMVLAGHGFFSLRALAKARKVLSYASDNNSEEGVEPEYCESEGSLTMDVKEEGIGSMQNAEIEVGDYVLVALQRKSLVEHFVVEALLIDSLDIEVKIWKGLGNEKFIFTDEVSFVIKRDVVLYLPKSVPVGGAFHQSGKFAFGINFA
ncbi:hypothetical protein QYM36_018523 [Artemia franciscana]|uniref:Uncharacterized protein n=1 Tax=Artemia franciscana TaxID=6661 RepID=A0AA88HCQ4_ARTSF|nr:hypothetical protein QYM36_018523 [Artemia franciscana]